MKDQEARGFQNTYLWIGGEEKEIKPRVTLITFTVLRCI